LVSPEEITTLRELVRHWIEANPDRAVLSVVGFERITGRRRMQTLPAHQAALGLLADVKKATAAVFRRGTPTSRHNRRSCSPACGPSASKHSRTPPRGPPRIAALPLPRHSIASGKRARRCSTSWKGASGNSARVGGTSRGDPCAEGTRPGYDRNRGGARSGRRTLRP
jgi:hypothetical protein